MEEKKIITLNLTDCKYLGELHERIKVAFDFPDWYGQNWSAFSDLLWSECDADKIIVIGMNTVPKELEKCTIKMKEILEREQADRIKWPDEMFEIVFVNAE